jgi:hypothetical protein
MKTKIDEIVIGDRRREDMGGISELAKSIQQYGLLHPIVLDDQKRLVVGGRRLEACKYLGWTEIEATFHGQLTDNELRMLELEENIRRKDLTEYEKSRDMVKLAEIVKTEIQPQEEFRPESDRNPGRPSQPDSLREVARVIGVPKTTLIDAYKHTKVVEKYPELKEVPKYKAIEASKQLDKLPEKKRQPVLQKIVEEPKGDISFMSEPDYVPPEERVQRLPEIRLDKIIYKFSTLVNGVTQWEGMEATAKRVPYDKLDYIANELDYMIKTMNTWKAIITAESKNQTSLRRVK